MKKFIAVAAILSVMFLGAGTSHALMGVPDAVPAQNILIPFCLVSIDGEGDDNTLFSIAEVGYVDDNGGPNDGEYDVTRDEGTSIHIRVYDVDSNIRLNFHEKLTAYDMFISDGKTLLGMMNETDRKACIIDIDGDETDDYYAFYVYITNESRDENQLIGHVYQVSVANGVVAGYLAVGFESFEPPGHLPLLAGYGDLFRDVEAFSANALYAAKQILLGNLPPNPARWFRLMMRYLLINEDSENFLIIWTDEEVAPADPDGVDIPLPGSLHVYWLDEEENAVSSNIVIDHELTFIDVSGIVPGELTSDDPDEAYASGWINLRTPDEELKGFDAERFWIGYSLQRAPVEPVNGTLDAIFEAHRDAGVKITILP